VTGGPPVEGDIVVDPGWQFTGDWYLDDDSLRPYDSGESVNGDIVYVAQYAEEPPAVITYHANLGGNEEYATSASVGALHTVLSFKGAFTALNPPTDKIFRGWSEDSNKGVPWYSPAAEFRITGDTDFYAVWEAVSPAQTFVVHFDKGSYGDFVSGAQEDFIVIKDSLFKDDPPEVVPYNDYSFTGWSPRVSYTDPVTENITYTALYAAVPKYLRFSGNNAYDTPQAGEVQAQNDEEVYDTKDYTVAIRFSADLKDPKVYYSNPAALRTINWVAADEKLKTLEAASTAVYNLPSYKNVGSHEIPLYFTAQGYQGISMIRFVKITPRPVTAAAEHDPIRVGTAPPASADYAASVNGDYPADPLNVNTLSFTTDYKQGDPAGSYPIWVASGAFGNYVIDADPGETDRARAGTLEVLSTPAPAPTPNPSSGTGTIPNVTPPAVETTPELNRDDHDAYIIGYPDGLVHPERNITREEAATIFFRLLTEGSRDTYRSFENPYPDVNADRWSNEAISTLMRADILTGYPDGSFQPSAFMTRAEFTALAARFDGGAGTGENLFSDIVGHWAQSEINRARTLGWAEGYEDGSFRPDNDITRAEVVTLINRALRRHVESAADLHPDMRVWPDNLEASWYYYDVQEASNSHAYHRKDDGLSEVWEAILENPRWN
jgi:hypothetical protein